MRTLLIAFLTATCAHAQFVFPEESLQLLRFDIFVPTTLYTESFEGAGFEVATTKTDAQTSDPDDTAHPTAGTQDLKMGATDGNAYPTAAFTSSSIVTFYGAFYVTAVTGTLSELYQFDGTPDNNHRGYIWINASGKLEVVGNGAGSVSATTIDSVLPNVQYKIKAIFNKTDGTYSAEFTTNSGFNFIGTSTKYASGVNGDTGVTIGDIEYRHPSAGVINYFDDNRITTP